MSEARDNFRLIRIVFHLHEAITRHDFTSRVRWAFFCLAGQWIRTIHSQAGKTIRSQIGWIRETNRNVDLQDTRTIEIHRKFVDLLRWRRNSRLIFLDEFEERNSKQQSIITDQQKMIQVFKDDQNKSKVFYEKQCTVLNEQCLREKNEIKAVKSTSSFH